jgi:sulfatase modifying factor 1
MDSLPSTEQPARTGGMIWIPGSVFRMGSDHHYPEEAPAHKVKVRGFWIDPHTVTNREFLRFVEATGHVTLAEKPANEADYPEAKPEMLAPSSVVFRKTAGPVDLGNPYSWWTYVPGADWRHPRGPDSTLQDLMDHPVVHVAFEDAEAYARWAGKELPTEAEWELAARGGLDGAEYVWGDELMPGGKPMANTWQGRFPWENLLEDGHEWTAPVGSFPPNGYGLYDMAGNVWQWTSDWYRPDYYARLAAVGGVARNPQGPLSPFDPSEPTEKKKVHRGGSFLCTNQYCSRYIVGTRGKGEVSTGTNHLGFRCVKDAAVGKRYF